MLLRGLNYGIEPLIRPINVLVGGCRGGDPCDARCQDFCAKWLGCGFLRARPAIAKTSRDRLRSCIEMCQDVKRATDSKSVRVSFVNMR